MMGLLYIPTPTPRAESASGCLFGYYCVDESQTDYSLEIRT